MIDMAAVIHMVPPTRAATFMEYVNLHIVPFLKAQLTTVVERIDAVWDTYPEQSLKYMTQQRRGSGPRTRLQADGDGSTPIPKKDWQSYLKNEENKKELFSFVSKQLVKADMGGKLLLSTESEMVLSNKPFDMSALQSCNHAEADTRIILHLMHASSQGHEKAFIRTVDSDIVVLAVAFFVQLRLKELYVGFGSGKHYRIIAVHNIHSQLGLSKSSALLLFHALTGCDTTSQFLGWWQENGLGCMEQYPGPDRDNDRADQQPRVFHSRICSHAMHRAICCADV